MRLTLFCLTTFLLLVMVSFVQARHIIGGFITYECLGDDEYEFTMRIYRDCNCIDCADFDGNAAVGIYQCNLGDDCRPLRQGQTIQQLLVPIQSIQEIDAPDYPCLIPPDICVQEGLYTFRVTLPQSNQSYHISYQRCCRNVTINNIIAPDESGATYTIEITPEVQGLCNSTPVFNNFPPTVVCANATLEFDHSATDLDGDSLVYSFCKPLLGGSDDTSPLNINTCFGAQPITACPPPYDSVRFLSPTYTDKAPMGGNPVVEIDPNTGLITGTPTTLGQFVVGVCVEEYRGDTLLSKVFRDFQFNVARCDPVVVADIDATRIMDSQEYEVTSCGAVDVQIENLSFDRSFIDVTLWQFDINGEIQTSSDWSPIISFPGLGTYMGELILNPNTDCGDTAEVVVNILPAINADFEFEYDTCFANPVQFMDLSETGGEFLTDWRWSFGDANSSEEQNPSHLYRAPGEMPVTLQVRDNNECVDQITKNVSYFPVPSLIVVSPSDFEGCAPGEVFFDNLSEPIDETYNIMWDFGDGGTSSDISPLYTYEQDGQYTVTLDITSPIGCETDTVFPSLISIRPAPTADFLFTPESPNNLNPLISFSDRSQDAIFWEWRFGEEGFSFERSPSYRFRDTGRYEVSQIVTHPSGCLDTIIKIIDIKPEVTYFLPNAFTPNGDSVNDTYKGVGIMEGARNFNFTIWNRWGELIFETSNPNEGWNGKKFNNGRESPNGVYVALVKFTTPRGEEREIKAFATLIR